MVCCIGKFPKKKEKKKRKFITFSASPFYQVVGVFRECTLGLLNGLLGGGKKDLEILYKHLGVKGLKGKKENAAGH